MIFERFLLADAEGALLAHGKRLPGGALPKGAVLTREALQALAAAGHTHVVAARLEPGDVAEDEAARRLASALAGGGLVAQVPAHGRANLVAKAAGLFRADAACIDALNLLHEGITVATLADATPVRAGGMLVTVKIIPFAIPGEVLARAEALAVASQPLRVAPFRALLAGLVVSELPGMKEAVLGSTEAVTRQRVEGLSGTLLPARRVPHEAAAIAAALSGLLAEGADLLLVAGASATVDRLDEGPAALVLAGGEVTHFGMPVDPGNLICSGRIGPVPALVLPGCARSPSLNGIDLVLARLFAGEPAGPGEIARMGVGGLLKDFAPRPAPRSAVARAHGVAAVILAAGLSTRMGPRNKLLVRDASGQAMVARVADAVLASRARPVSVVLGHQSTEVRQALAGRDVRFVEAVDYAQGLSASLRAGLASVPADAAAVLVCLGDMPLVSTAEIDRLLAAYDPNEGRLIVVPTHRGKRGNPVLWDRRFFDEMVALSGDTGARALLLRHAEWVAEVELETDAVLVDFDTPEAVEAATR
jgi:molybdenum cofactor cytidylyltransferase